MKISLPNFFMFLLFTILLGFQQAYALSLSDKNDLSEVKCMPCLTAPLLFCPSTYFGCPDDDLNPAMTGTPIALPGDTNCPTPILSYVDTLVINTPCLKKYHRIWKAQYHPDSASVKLISQCVQTLYLEDTDAPTLSNCPSNIEINLFESCDSTAVWSLPTATDDCSSVSITSNFNSGDSFTQGSTEVLIIAADSCGRQDTCSFLINVMGICCQNLTITCPSDTTACVNSTLDPIETGFAVVSMPDSTCTNPLISYSDSLLMNNPNCSNGQIIQRTWMASDSSMVNIYDSCIQIITTEDDESPQITNMPTDTIVFGVGESCSVQVFWPEPVAVDSCGIFAFTSNIPNGSFFSEGTSIVSYAALDYCGNTAFETFLITVECEITCDKNPIINCPADFISCPLDSIPSPDISGWAQAEPGDSLCLSPIISYTDSIISSGPCPGAVSMIRTWKATDPDNDNLYSICSQNITLNDNQAPIITGVPQDISVTGNESNCLVMVNWTPPSVSDNCGIASFTSNVPNGSFFSEGTTTVVYTAIDSCGLIATGSFEIFVECISPCSQAPVIQCPSNYWACPTGSIPNPSVSGYALAYPGSIDCSSPQLTYSDLIVASGPCPTAKIIDRTWLAIDPDNPTNTSSCVQRLSLEDNQPPYIWYCPNNIVVTANNSSCSTPVSWNSPLATDNCSAPNLYISDQNGNTVQNGQVFNMGTTYVSYNAVDICGNTTVCQFTVTVQCGSQCNMPPTIQCPPNKTVCPGSSTSPQSLGWAVATASAYCPSPVVNYTDLISSTGPCYGEKTIYRTWTANFGNYNTLSSSCVQNIQLKDDTAPVFTNCPSDITVYNTATPVNWNVPYAYDNCSVPIVTNSHSPGSYFPQGVTTVQYTAKDNCWNTSVCSFKVTVQTQYNISLNCPSDLYLNCNNNGGAYANWNIPSYNGSCGNCDGNNYFPGFIYMGSLNGHQYYCSTGTATWPQAKAICSSYGGYLASINNAEENQFLANILTLQSAWIGLSDSQLEGTYIWESGEPYNYSNWYAGQPNNYNNNQDFIEMLNDGKWNDQYNHYSLEYIMEIPCSFVQQIAGPQPGTFLTGGNYTVQYEVQDACGGYGTCSFDIIVSGGLNVECPDNIVVTAPPGSTGVPVTWQEPEVSSCCTQCQNQNGQAIQGFVYMGSLNGHEYYCSTSTTTWPQAKLIAEYNGGYLAIIETEEENNFLTNLLTLQSAWIGMSDSETEGTFKWVNGQSPSYTNWYLGQPNNYGNNQDYVELLNDGLWNDQYNHYQLEYIVEIPSCINITQTSGPLSGSILPPGSQHTVSYLVTDGCGNSMSCSFSIDVQGATTTTKDYCKSQGDYSGDFHITQVRFGNMTSNSGDNGGYKDFTDKCATISQGQSYEIYLTPSSMLQDRTYWRVWIDYNHDGDFFDFNEMVAYGSGFSTVSGVITIPNVILGGETRMRIIMTPGSYPLDPCDNYPNGETEDYCLNTIGTGNISDIGNLELRNRQNESSSVTLESFDILQISVYPNPAVDQITIRLDSYDNIENLLLTDINGKNIEVWNSREIYSSMNYSVDHLPAGIYLLSAKMKDNSLIHKRIIVGK